MVIHPSSYRDSSGFVFEQDGFYYRQVNKEFAEEYEMLMKSGLYHHLVKKNWLVSHDELREFPQRGAECYKILMPEQVYFPNYPYEWCFDQLKDAALLTIGMLKAGIEYGMILKDATPFNIFFRDHQPLFIDSLSFEKYDPSKPWKAYRQFCECFLCPLLLSAHHGSELIKLIAEFPDGIPISVCASMLPFTSRFVSLTALHVHLQARIAKANNAREKDTIFSKAKLLRIADHLESGISRLKEKKKASAWKKYYEEIDHSEEYIREKDKIFISLLERIFPSSALDIGCNTGHYSILSALKGIQTVAIDNDGSSVNKLYCHLKEKNIEHVLPLFVDITNPSPSIGWNHAERVDFLSRKKFDLVMTFAIVHHLAISKNIPFGNISSVLHSLSSIYALVEFVEPDDEKARELLGRRGTGPGTYSRDNFEKSFLTHFTIETKIPIPGVKRSFYLLRRK